MALRVLTSLRNSLLRITNSRMLSTNYPSFPLLFPPVNRHYLVDEWLTLLCTENFGLADMQVFVDSITQLKLNRDQEHEKTVIKLNVVPRDGTATFSTYITTERGAELDEASSSLSLLPASANGCTSCAVHKLISGSDIPAIDRVVIPATLNRLTFEEYMMKQKNSHIVLCQITLNLTMTLPQLAVLLNTIHDISSEYDVLKYNCYWYTHTLGEVIRCSFDGLVSSAEHIARRGFCGIIDLRRQDSFHQVTKDYNETWKEMEKKIAEHMRAQQVRFNLSVLHLHLLSLNIRRG